MSVVPLPITDNRHARRDRQPSTVTDTRMNGLPMTELIQRQFPQWVLGAHQYCGDETLLIKREGLLEACRFLRDDSRTAFKFLMDLTCVDYLTFGKRLESMPTTVTPSPLPYFMKPKPVTESWERIGDRAGTIPAGDRAGKLRSGEEVSATAGLPTEEVPRAAERAAADGARFEVVYHLYSHTHTRRLRVKVPVGAADAVVDSVTGLWKAADWFEREVWDMFGIRFEGHPTLKRILMYEPFDGHPLRKDYPVRKRQPLIGPVN
jgi:NADH-quinone oxidoreductase subunit C